MQKTHADKSGLCRWAWQEKSMYQKHPKSSRHAAGSCHMQAVRASVRQLSYSCSSSHVSECNVACIKTCFLREACLLSTPAEQCNACVVKFLSGLLFNRICDLLSHYALILQGVQDCHCNIFRQFCGQHSTILPAFVLCIFEQV